MVISNSLTAQRQKIKALKIRISELANAKRTIAEQDTLAQAVEEKHRNAVATMKMTQFRELQQQSESVEKVQHDLDAAHETQNAVQSNLTVREGENDRLRKKLSVITDSLREMESTTASITQKNTGLEEFVRSKQSENEEVQSKMQSVLNDTQAALSKNEERLGMARVEKVALTAELRTGDQMRRCTSDQLDALKADIKSQQHRIVTLEDANAQFTEQNDEKNTTPSGCKQCHYPKSTKKQEQAPSTDEAELKNMFRESAAAEEKRQMSIRSLKQRIENIQSFTERLS